MKQSGVIKIVVAVPYQHSRIKNPSLMVTTKQGRTPSRNAITRLKREDLRCLQFKMVGGVHLVSQRLRLSTNMVDRLPVGKMEKVDLGLIKFITSKVSYYLQYLL